MNIKINQELEKIINDKGKFLTIGYFLEVRGWKVQIITSGRMKSPDEMKYDTQMKEFTKFDIRDFTIFIEKQLLSKRTINFTIPRIGNYEIITVD